MNDFKFDINDYLKIPGLYRGNSDRPFLAPVFFEKEVLVRYLYDPRYRCEFGSETYGTIYFNGDYIPFGINKNQKVIMWLGDLDELSDKEKLYLLTHNIDSDHDIKSEFYDAQIDARFTDPVREVEILTQKVKINKLFSREFSFKLFKSENRDIDGPVEACSKYKKLIMNSKDDFKKIVSEWNESLIENMNNKDLKNFLDSKDIKIEGDYGPIKLLECFVQNILNIKENIISPYFILYDLRIWADHMDASKKINSALKRLEVEVEDKRNYSIIYKKLIDQIDCFHNKLIEKLKE